MRQLIWMMITFVLLFGCSTDTPYLKADFAQVEASEYEVEVEMEHLYPINEKRQIEITSANILFGKENPCNNNWSYYSGATITNAWGNIIQTNDSFQEVKCDSPALGFGPILLARYEPLKGNRLSFSADFSLGLIFYNEDFPAGGKFYNFMWRIGPNFTYQIHDSLSLSIGYKVAHVSNGNSSHNPSCNGKGISMSVKKSF